MTDPAVDVNEQARLILELCHDLVNMHGADVLADWLQLLPAAHPVADRSRTALHVAAYCAERQQPWQMVLQADECAKAEGARFDARSNAGRDTVVSPGYYFHDGTRRRS